jgi:hypothetical protein
MQLSRRRSPRVSLKQKRPDLVAEAIQGLQSADLEELISKETGLSHQTVRLGLDSSFHRLGDELKLLAALQGPRASRGFISLAGNVFVACLRPFACAAVLGVPLLARVSSRESAFATALAEVLLPFCDIELLHFPHSDDASFRAAIKATDFCEAYGSDETLDALQSLAPDARIIRRGHGLGVALLGPALKDIEYDALAEDIAAYDQRGCLSPRIIFAEDDLSEHAAELDDALTRIEQHLPRGHVPTDVQAASSQWRASAAALHSLREASSHAIVADETGRFPLGPTHRHILLRPSTLAHEALARLGPHTKVIGHAGLAATPQAACRVCPLGQMQRPRLSGAADGHPVGAGFIVV